MKVTTSQTAGRYGVMLNAGMDNEELCERYHFYPDALKACREHLQHGDDADVVKILSNGSYTYDY